MDATIKYRDELEAKFKATNPDKYGEWLFNAGYFPEEYVLPPCFRANGNLILPKPIFKKRLKRISTHSLSFPKSKYHKRKFEIISPEYYHDIVLIIINNFSKIVTHLFDKRNRIVSYSIPFSGDIGSPPFKRSTRSGKLIYEYLEMSESHLIADSTGYEYLIKTDITNFYNSIYMHTVAWALHGKKMAFDDKVEKLLFGSKLDNLLTYSNSATSIGLPVGSILSDFVAEIVLAAVGKEFSDQVRNFDLDFRAVRFKDDFRFLCKSKEDSIRILNILSEVLSVYKLNLNESKTLVYEIPDGFFRHHIVEYFTSIHPLPSSIRLEFFKQYYFKVFIIDNNFPGTSIFIKFYNSLFLNNNLIVSFENHSSVRKREYLELLNLFFHLKSNIPKITPYFLSIFESIYKNERNNLLKKELREYLKFLFLNLKSDFDILWFLFLWRSLNFSVDHDLRSFCLRSRCVFVHSVLSGKRQFFIGSRFDLFQTPTKFNPPNLVEYLNVFS